MTTRPKPGAGRLGVPQSGPRFSPPRAPLLVLCLLIFAGCQQNGTLRTGGTDLDGFARLVSPHEIEVQEYLTKPVSFEGSGDPDGIELILELRDGQGHQTKGVGTLVVELYATRTASGDRHGTRIALWTVELRADDSLKAYWDNLARWFKFPLLLKEATLTPGRYILAVQLATPTGDKLVDEYEFRLEAGPVQSASARP